MRLALVFALALCATLSAADEAAADVPAAAADAPAAEEKTFAAVESEEEYKMSPEELKALQDQMKKDSADAKLEEQRRAAEEANSNAEDGPDQDPSDTGIAIEGGVFWIALLAVYSTWLFVHGVSTAKDLIPALKELASGGKAKQEDGGFAGGKNRRGNKGASGNNKSASLKITQPALLKKLAVLTVGYAVFHFASGAIASSMDHLGTFDPYKTLGVSTSDSKRTIKAAYRKLSLKWHPDKNKDEPDRELVKKNFMKVNKAFKIITMEQRGEKVTAADYSMDS